MFRSHDEFDDILNPMALRNKKREVLPEIIFLKKLHFFSKPDGLKGPGEALPYGLRSSFTIYMAYLTIFSLLIKE